MASLIPQQIETLGTPPDQVVAYLSINSRGGNSVLDIKSMPKRVEAYHGRPNDTKEAVRVAEALGLQIVTQSRLGMAVVGPPQAFEELTGGRIVAKEMLLYAEAGRRRYVTHLDIVGDSQPEHLGCGRPSTKAAGIEAVILERPRAPQAAFAVPATSATAGPQAGGIFPSPIPPTVSGFCLRLPHDVALGLGTPGANQQGFRGQGVTVAMVDTGHFLHPFFTAHHYKVRTPITIVPGTNKTKDPVGHGTGESANIFASAPDAELQPIRASDDSGQLVGALEGFMKGKELKPQILTNSWGGDMPFPPGSNTLAPQDAAFALELKDAVEQGIFVIFSAGNGQFSVEPQVLRLSTPFGLFRTFGELMERDRR